MFLPSIHYFPQTNLWNIIILRYDYFKDSWEKADRDSINGAYVRHNSSNYAVWWNKTVKDFFHIFFCFFKHCLACITGLVHLYHSKLATLEVLQWYSIVKKLQYYRTRILMCNIHTGLSFSQPVFYESKLDQSCIGRILIEQQPRTKICRRQDTKENNVDILLVCIE